MEKEGLPNGVILISESKHYDGRTKYACTIPCTDHSMPTLQTELLSWKLNSEVMDTFNQFLSPKDPASVQMALWVLRGMDGNIHMMSLIIAGPLLPKHVFLTAFALCPTYRGRGLGRRYFGVFRDMLRQCSYTILSMTIWRRRVDSGLRWVLFQHWNG